MCTDLSVLTAVTETIVLLDLSLVKSDGYLPSPQAQHEFIVRVLQGPIILDDG